MKLPPKHYICTYIIGSEFFQSESSGVAQIQNMRRGAFVTLSRSAFERLVKLAKQAQHTNKALEQEEPAWGNTGYQALEDVK